MLNLAIIIGSTRPGRRGSLVASWANQQILRHPRILANEARIDTIDLADVDLPFLDEPVPAMFGAYSKAHTKMWAERISKFDGFVIVTPEYNHTAPAALMNAVDYLFDEWVNKSAGFVSYGVDGGVRAVEQLRLKFAEVKVACVRGQVALSLYDDFVIDDPLQVGELKPRGNQSERLGTMIDDLLDWSGAFQPLRVAGIKS